jgi:hypothetical protein
MCLVTHSLSDVRTWPSLQRDGDGESRMRSHNVFLGLVPLVASSIFLMLHWVDHVTALATICLLVGILATVAEWRGGIARGTGYTRLFLLLGFLFWFWIPGFATSLNPTQFADQAVAVSIDNADALFAYLLVSIFFLVFLLTSAVRPGDTSSSRGASAMGATQPTTPGHLVATAFALGVIGFGIYVVAAGGNPVAAIEFAMSGRDGTKPWSSEGNFGTNVTTFANVAKSCLIVAAVLGLGCALAPRVDGSRVPQGLRLAAFSIAIACTLWVSADSGTRSSLLQCTAPAAFVVFRILQGQIRGGTRMIALLFLALLSVSIVYGASVQRAYRTADTQRVSAPGREVGFRIQDNDFMSQTAYGVAVQREYGRHTNGFSVVQVLVGPIPHSLWPEKPLQSSTVVFSRYVRGQDIVVTGGNTFASIVGQHYLDWGIPGVVAIGILYGLLARFIDRTVQRGAPFLALAAAALAASYLFLSFRVLAIGYLFPVVVVLFVIWRARRRAAWRQRNDLAPSDGHPKSKRPLARPAHNSPRGRHSLKP